jgi:hypothetical protein
LAKKLFGLSTNMVIGLAGAAVVGLFLWTQLDKTRYIGKVVPTPPIGFEGEGEY